MAVYLLIDNGSKMPEATLRLRALAAALSEQTGRLVHAVSLQHAETIPVEALAGLPAETFTPFLRQQLASGERAFVVLPLFFGQSRALSSYIPQQCELLEAEFGDFSLRLAEVIYPLPAGDERLARILLEHIQSVRTVDSTPVVLVDHGSPSPVITAVRRHVAQSLTSLLEDKQALAEAVMERREGKEYDFNGALLETWLREQAEQGVRSVIVAMMFFLPGRHAGACGDVEEICDRVIRDHPQLSVSITPLISDHPLLVDILADRLHAVQAI